MYSGTVPALIYYGLKFLNPSYLLVSAFIISAMTSIATGTAWDQHQQQALHSYQSLIN